MSTFLVEQKKIEKIWEHPNADKLSLAKVEGLDFQFVIGKDSYNVGDTVIYFPVDSELPITLIEHMNMVGKFSGKKSNRIKTIKLRGEISQGYVCNDDTIAEYIDKGHYPDIDWEYPETILTQLLGVIKYEPPEIPCQNGNLIPLPDGVSMYDIEGTERYPEIVELLMDQPCYITEKIEGSNFGLTITHDDQIIVNQRKHAIVEIDDGEHMFWKTARKMKLSLLAFDIRQKFGGKQITLRGEFIGPGVQGNYYQLKEHKVLLFDVMIDGRYLGASDFIENVPESGRVPVLNHIDSLRDWLKGMTIDEASTGPSIYINRLREGIVIRPLDEQYVRSFGRVIIKKRSCAYLAKEKD